MTGGPEPVRDGAGEEAESQVAVRIGEHVRTLATVTKETP